MVVALVCGVLCGLAGLAVSLTLAAGIGLFIAIELLKERRVNWSAVAILAALGLGLGVTLLQFRLFYATELGKELQHGHLSGIVVQRAPLMLVIPLLFGRASRSDPENLLVKCLLASAIIVAVFCESVELGFRLWFRGALAFAFLACTAWLITNAERIIMAFGGALKPPTQQSALFNGAALVLVVVMLVGATLYARPPRPDMARGYVDPEKYEVLTWLDSRVGRGGVVASTNIEDSFLIDAYTQATPFVPLYALSVLSQTSLVKRYFHVIDLLESGDAVAKSLRTVSPSQLTQFNADLVTDRWKKPYDYAGYQPLAFYHMLLYYPYNHATKDIFRDDSPTPQFLNWLDETREGAKSEFAKFRYDYLIVSQDEAIKRPDRFEVAFRNSRYLVLRSK
jgi:hypothetical protein